MELLKNIINYIVKVLQLAIPVAIWLIIAINFAVAIFSGFQQNESWITLILIGHLATAFYTGISILFLMAFTGLINRLHLLKSRVDFKLQLSTFKYYWITLLGFLFAAEIHFLQL